MKNNTSYRDRLLAHVRPELRAEAARVLCSYSNNPNEPIFWFFALVVEEQAHTRTEVEKQKWRIFALTGPDNWKRIVYSWALVPALIALFVLCTIAFLNHQNTAVIRKLSAHPEEMAAYAKDTLRALEVANDNATSINAVADLLNIPEARAGIQGGKFVIIVPDNSITIQSQNEHEKRIILNGDLRKIFGRLQKASDDADKQRPIAP